MFCSSEAKLSFFSSGTTSLTQEALLKPRLNPTLFLPYTLHQCPLWDFSENLQDPSVHSNSTETYPLDGTVIFWFRVSVNQGGEESPAGNRSALGLCKSLFVQDKIKVPSILFCSQFYALQENKSATECLCGMILLLFSFLKFCTSQSCQFTAQRISQLQKKRHEIFQKRR